MEIRVTRNPPASVYLLLQAPSDKSLAPLVYSADVTIESALTRMVHDLDFFSGFKQNAMNSNQKTLNQREQTNQSLNSERRTDDALALKRKLTQDMADEIVDRARGQADEVLVAARHRADIKLDCEGGEGGLTPEVAREAVAQERVDEDVMVQKERDCADDNLRWERDEQARILAALLPLERSRTDRFLLTERGLSDDAVVNRDDLMGMVSHDLQNLLAGIAIHARVLASKASDSEEGRRTVTGMARIERYVAGMNRLIGDLVDVTSIDAGKFAVQPEPGNVTEMVSEGIASVAQSAEEKGLALEFATDGHVLHGIFDRERMLQVIANLIANAMKFTPSGGAIDVKVERVEDKILVSVLDTGEGIAEEMREAIFDRFAQVGKLKPKGLGLGLYISKSIVEAQGGRIWAEGNPAGPGSAFYLTIPADQNVRVVYASRNTDGTRNNPVAECHSR